MKSNTQQLPRPTKLAHNLLGNVLQPGDQALDATAGNGHDTEFLARAVGHTGHVLALDVQAHALESTRARCLEAGVMDQVTLMHADHALLDSLLVDFGWKMGTLSAVVFNLGYLPGADKNLATSAVSTLKALNSALTWLRPGGLLTIVCYPGYPAGDIEAQEVESWASALPIDSYLVALYRFLNPVSPAPFLLAVEKRAC